MALNSIALLILLFVIMFHIGVGGVASDTEENLAPSFDNSVETNVTIQIGLTAHLICKVRNLGDKKVSWIRHNGLHILTVGRYTYTSDQRIQTIYKEETDEWILQIKYATKRDSGKYECQINSDPRLSMFYHLEVYGPSATILGPPDQVVSPGGTIIITCILVTREMPDSVNWYHNETLISVIRNHGVASRPDYKAEYNNNSARISVIHGAGRTHANKVDLVVSSAAFNDSGEYTCSPSNNEPATAKVIVFSDSCSFHNLAIPNAVFNTSRREIRNNEEVNVTCRERFKIKSQAQAYVTVRCVHGMWVNSDAVKCVPYCLTPSVPSNVDLVNANSGSYLKGEQVLVNCSEGYFVLEDAVSMLLLLTCRGSNLWEPNELLCIPKEQITTIYKPQQEQVMEVQEGDRLLLPCQHKKQRGKTENHGTAWTWLKDSVDITTLPDFEHSVSAVGSLILPKVTNEFVGSYTCLILTHSQQIPSDVMFNVRVRGQCIESPTNTSTTVEQNAVAILTCPNSDSQTLLPPIWFGKDGKRIYNNNKFSLVLNSLLLIQSVQHSDEGTYLCRRSSLTPFCEKYVANYLQVNPMECGLSTSGTNSPWLVILWQEGEILPLCYGILVRENWVLTTASCLLTLRDKQTSKYFVEIGQSSPPTQQKLIAVNLNSIKLHPNYSHGSNEANIGVFKLKKHVQFGKDVMAICLSDEDDTPTEMEPAGLQTMTGRVPGLSSFSPGHQPVILESEPEFMETMEVIPCPELTQSSSDGVFCAKGEGLVAKYVADQGSPFEIHKNGRYYLYGILSSPKRRSGSSDQDYFTKLSNYYSWVIKSIKK